MSECFLRVWMARVGQLVVDTVKALCVVDAGVHVESAHIANGGVGRRVFGQVEHVELVLESGRMAIHVGHADEDVDASVARLS